MKLISGRKFILFVESHENKDLQKLFYECVQQHAEQVVVQGGDLGCGMIYSCDYHALVRDVEKQGQGFLSAQLFGMFEMGRFDAPSNIVVIGKTAEEECRASFAEPEACV